MSGDGVEHPQDRTIAEIAEKRARLARIAQHHGVAGVLVTLQPNFAWLTAGESNRIDGSTESGAGALCVAQDGTLHLIANTIEMPRLRDEALRHIDVRTAEYPWARDHEDRSIVASIAADVVGGRVGADTALDGVEDLSGAVARAQVPLTRFELDRFRTLGRDAGRIVGEVCRTLEPGLSELAVAGRAAMALAAVGARALVLLVGADDRIAAFRHPVPTDRVWKRTALLGVCAERQGLVVALSRIVSAGPPAGDLSERTDAAAHVFGKLLNATRRGATGADLFRVAADAYSAAGYRGQEALHHQGGAIGYRSRDWIAYPGSRASVNDPQAFAWNPSITGTKIEETALLVDDTIELITTTAGWPAIVTEGVKAPGILAL